MHITRNEDKSSPGMVFLSGTLYDFICLTLSITVFCKIGTFYGSMVLWIISLFADGGQGRGHPF